MRVTETMKDAALKVGMLMAKVDTKTSCPWINYQPCEPDALAKMRKKRKGINFRNEGVYAKR